MALATLAHERRLGSVFARRPPQTSTGRAVAEATAEAEDAFKPYVWYPQRAGRADLVAGLTKTSAARTRPRDPPGGRPPPQPGAGRAVDGASSERVRGPSAGRPGRKALSASSTATRSPARPRTSTRSWPDRKRCSAGRWPARRPCLGDPGLRAAASIAGGTDEIQHNILGEPASSACPRNRRPIATCRSAASRRTRSAPATGSGEPGIGRDSRLVDLTEGPQGAAKSNLGTWPVRRRADFCGRRGCGEGRPHRRHGDSALLAGAAPGVRDPDRRRSSPRRPHRGRVRGGDAVPQPLVRTQCGLRRERRAGRDARRRGGRGAHDRLRTVRRAGHRDGLLVWHGELSGQDHRGRLA